MSGELTRIGDPALIDVQALRGLISRKITDHHLLQHGYTGRAIALTSGTARIDTIDHALDPPVFQVQNAEGEELLFCTLHYPLAAMTL